MVLTDGQLRAARGFVGWSQEELAAHSKVSRSTIADFETGKRLPYPRTLDAIRRSLEGAGIEFTADHGGGPRVRLRTR